MFRLVAGLKKQVNEFKAELGRAEYMRAGEYSWLRLYIDTIYAVLTRYCVYNTNVMFQPASKARKGAQGGTSTSRVCVGQAITQQFKDDKVLILLTCL
jgi:hypothetical protein